MSDPASSATAFAAWLRTAGRQAIRQFHAMDASGPPLAEIRDLTIEGGAAPMAARLYRPEGVTAPAPAMAFFHGGGFFSCDIETHDGMCRWLAAASGAVIVSFDYRLAPEHRFPAQIDDALHATRWLASSAGALGLDPARLAVGGDSAGAFLAAATAMTLNRERPGAVALQLLIYPLMRIDETACASEVATVVRMLGQAAARFVHAQVMQPGQTTPTGLGEDLTGTPATIMVSGGLDPLRAEAADYAGRLRGAGVALTEFVYPKLAHGALSFPGTSQAVQGWLAEIGQAMGQALDH